MKSKRVPLLKKLVFVLLVLALLVASVSINAYAESANIDPIIMVSMGDSYSSGEGIEPYYGQEKPLTERVYDQNWVAHRSQKSWPSMLKIPGVSGTMGDYFVNTSISSTCQWYFVAASGAETKHFNNVQEQEVNKLGAEDHVETFPKQLSIFSHIPEGMVDYVTMTIGGNDVKFAQIIEKCAKNVGYFDISALSNLINKLWNNIEEVEKNIKQVYLDTQNAAGTQATIIVAGYPKLLDKNGKGALINKKEATIVNDNVHKFNEKIEAIVNECRRSGMNICFVDVEEEFDKNGGHQAYSSDSWIHGIIIPSRFQDVEGAAIYSKASMHPNELGAQAYARCVNAKIQELENQGTISGKICQATDRITPIENANISVYNSDNQLCSSAVSNASGNYSLTLPAGNYRIEISAVGYIQFTAYATVSQNEDTYMETFLMVSGTEGEMGTATGIISNALTGNGVEGVSLSVRNGWNNTEHGSVLTSVATSADGSYSLTLPVGNYTMFAEKSGYISTPVNIIVQPGRTDSQNGTITPIISGDNFRIVLTWGANPRDLDSHVEGMLSGGSPFHVYYGHKSQYDADVEVCNLDVDDTSGYGPETITLNTTTDSPYYYYIYRFAGSGTVASSEAQIKVYQGENLVATFNVPTNLGNGDYWNAFAIVNGELVVRNTITSSKDIHYASTI